MLRKGIRADRGWETKNQEEEMNNQRRLALKLQTEKTEYAVLRQSKDKDRE